MPIFYYFVSSFIVGVGLQSVPNSSGYSVATLSILLLILVIYRYIGERSISIIIAVIIVGMVFGGMRVYVSLITHDQFVLDAFASRDVSVEGIIIREPSTRNTTERIVVLVDTVNETLLQSKTYIVASVSKYPSNQFGDRVLLFGTLEYPQNFENELGRTFNYVDYLAKDDIYYTMLFPHLTHISSGHGNKITSSLLYIKHIWLRSIEQILPDPHAALLGGLVVGAKESLGSELEDAFRRTGIIHIVVLSGYNVTIVAEAIMRVFSFLPRLFGLSLGALSIVFFAILTGASATIVRASIMALLVLLARATGRTSDITRMLFIAAFVMVLHNPMIVIYDPSFQLSFLATLGLIYVAPKIETYFKLIPTKWQLREFATATVATQLFVMPLLLYMVGEFSVAALPVNVMVLALIPLTMLYGFMAGLLGIVSPILAFPFTAITYSLLSYELFIVELFSKVPFASLPVPEISIVFVVVMYVCALFVLYRLHREK